MPSLDTVRNVNYQKKKNKISIRKKEKKKKEEKSRYKYGSRRKGGSSTNIEKRKSKPYAMLRRKALSKQQRGIRQKLKVKDEHVRTMKSQKLDHH